MEHSFGSAAPFTVGMEEELLIVDPVTRELSHSAEQVLPALEADPGTASFEAYSCELELRSPPLRTIGEATVFVAAMRRLAREAGGATLMAAGLHPTARWGDVSLVDQERYRRASEQMRGLFQRTAECALHVHVGLPDADAAVRAFNSVREAMPLLQGLSANSPWWFGRDSGLASARYSLVRSFPTRGIPDRFGSFDEYAERIAAVTEAGRLDDYTFVWWDLRLHPRLGTLEVREMDVQSSLPAAAALAALIQTLAFRGAERSRAAGTPSEALGVATFLASRDGLDAMIAHDGSARPLREVAAGTLDELLPFARELGCEAELGGIEEILREGNGADRRRAAHARGGVPEMLRELVADTAAGYAV